MTDSSADHLPNLTLSLPEGPKERPKRPAELNRSTVRSYVQRFESRYAYNLLRFSENSEVWVDCTVESVTEYRQGYNVTVSCNGYSNTRGPSNDDETATVLHADYPRGDYVYYVDVNSTLRTSAVGAPEGWRPTATPVQQPTPTGESA